MRAERSPQITLSMAYRFIHRPKTSSYGVHQSLQDLHKIMTATAVLPLVSMAAKSSSKGSGISLEPAVSDLGKQPLVVPVRRKEQQLLERPLLNGNEAVTMTNEAVTNGYHHGLSGSKTFAFGESLRGIKHMDDTSSTASSSLNNNNVANNNVANNNVKHNVNNNAGKIKMGKSATLDRFLVTNGDATFSSSSTASFPEFTEKLTEASEFVKKNPVRRPGADSASAEDTPKSSRHSKSNNSLTEKSQPRIRIGLKYSADHNLGRDSPIFLQFFYLFSIFFLNCF
jgi:hypothetical protein